MDNYILMGKGRDDGGFTRTKINSIDFTYSVEQNTKKLLQISAQAHQKRKEVVYRPSSEEMLRFALEKSPVDIIVGVEAIHPKDSLHYLRSGLDQVLCRIAREKGKTVAFSFADVLNSSERGKLLARMRFNIQLCRKYKVKMLFSTFAASPEELRPAHDLRAFWRVLEKRKK